MEKPKKEKKCIFDTLWTRKTYQKFSESLMERKEKERKLSETERNTQFTVCRYINKPLFYRATIWPHNHYYGQCS